MPKILWSQNRVINYFFVIVQIFLMFIKGLLLLWFLFYLRFQMKYLCTGNCHLCVIFKLNAGLSLRKFVFYHMIHIASFVLFLEIFVWCVANCYKFKHHAHKLFISIQWTITLALHQWDHWSIQLIISNSLICQAAGCDCTLCQAVSLFFTINFTHGNWDLSWA